MVNLVYAAGENFQGSESPRNTVECLLLLESSVLGLHVAAGLFGPP